MRGEEEVDAMPIVVLHEGHTIMIQSCGVVCRVNVVVWHLEQLCGACMW